MRQLTLCVVAFVFAIQSFAQDVPSSVLVVLAGNDWLFNGKHLTRGQTLPLDSEIRESGTKSPELILECGKAGWLSYSCGKVPCSIKACQAKDSNVEFHRVDLQPRGKASSESSSDSWFSSLFKREPATLAVLGVREGGHVTDSVLRQTEAEIHLAPALIRVLEGKYCLRFTPLPPGDSSLTRTVTIDWDRSTDAEGLIQLANLQSGLYVLEKSDSEAAGSCTFQPNPTPAWVLVVSDHDFTTLTTQWKDYTAQMREMERSGASPTVLLTVRHAALAHLADSITGSK